MNDDNLRRVFPPLALATRYHLLQRTLAVREKLLARASPRSAEAQILLAECHLALSDVRMAQSLANAAAAIQALHCELGEHFRRPLRQSQTKLDHK